MYSTSSSPASILCGFSASSLAPGCSQHMGPRASTRATDRTRIPVALGDPHDRGDSIPACRSRWGKYDLPVLPGRVNDKAAFDEGPDENEPDCYLSRSPAAIACSCTRTPRRILEDTWGGDLPIELYRSVYMRLIDPFIVTVKPLRPPRCSEQHVRLSTEKAEQKTVYCSLCLTLAPPHPPLNEVALRVGLGPETTMHHDIAERLRRLCSLFCPEPWR
ncbi:uncharacterized protein B0H18DRAFT_141601 [Fomitopsis serialis]|uniref:uncharacterized protein n=1 Tax=Fomitopsis serialis TaxID=139415 RepID=UPI00200740C6|nr:uncharacterized protein B0H18DRAFT_141601 [Neoantrodia serialis]KAH9914137.1 hypothetical protein B0H18DRAFT_141601 [Neoantrodia serialis]